jgi:hypothetical protein
MSTSFFTAPGFNHSSIYTSFITRPRPTFTTTAPGAKTTTTEYAPEILPEATFTAPGGSVTYTPVRIAQSPASKPRLATKQYRPAVLRQPVQSRLHVRPQFIPQITSPRPLPRPIPPPRLAAIRRSRSQSQPVTGTHLAPTFLTPGVTSRLDTAARPLPVAGPGGACSTLSYERDDDEMK